MGEFAAGLMQGMGKGQQVSQERAFQKQTLDLAQKKFKLEEQEGALKLQMLQQQIQQQGGMMGLLEKLLAGQQPGGQPPVAPGIEAPVMGQPVPPSGAPTQGPAGGFQLGGINISEKGGVGFKLEPPNLQKTETTLDVGGQPTRFQGTFDPRTGQFGAPQAIGRAPVGQRLEQLRAEARSLGFKEGTPEFENAVGRLGIVEKLPEAQRSLALDQLQSQAAQQGQAKPAGSFTQQFKQASVLEADRITQETAAREEANLKYGALPQDAQKALEAQSVDLANARFILSNFTETEIQNFVGLIQRPTEETKLALKGMGFALGLSGPVMESRFAQFKVANERARKTAFGAGGKQLTPFEASVVFGFTVTGRETTAAEYLIKLKSMIAFLEISQDVRLELARTGGGKIDPAQIDALIQQRMSGVGGGAPQRVPQQPGAGTPATAVPGGGRPRGKLKFNPQTGRIE